MIMTKFFKTMAGSAAFLAASCAVAAPAIQSITATQQAGTDVVRIELSEPIAAEPAGFVVQAPPRIAIDLPGVSNALGRNAVEVNQGNLRTVNVAQAGERTRLVLNLRQPSTYRANLQGKVLLLTLDASSAAPAVSPGAVRTASPAASPDTHTVPLAQSRNATPPPLNNHHFP